MILTTVDNMLSLPVGNDYTCKKTDGNSVKNKIETRVKQIQICLRCPLTSTDTCLNVISSSGDVCSSYREGKTPAKSACHCLYKASDGNCFLIT